MSTPLLPARRPERLDDVDAVLVVHDGARWLAEVLAALAALTVGPRAVVAVDTGSTDASPDLLKAAVDDGLVLRVLERPRTTGYGAAVAAGVEELDRDGGPTEWLWLLHDDAAPAPDCLSVLHGHAAASPSTALVGPKALDWNDPRVLVEVGITTDRSGHRETGLERRERDQGQHDAPRDVLAVGTAGALVRRTVWDAVGGFAPELPLYRDELDLGWRVTAAGSRVVVVPAAVVRHVRASTTGQRAPGAVNGDALAVDRRHALLVLLAHASTPRLLLGVPALLAMQALRVLGHLLTRSVRAARAEALAPVDVLGRPVRLLRMRRERARTRTPGAAVGPLLASRAGRLRARVESSAALLAGSGAPAHARGGGLGDPDAPDAAGNRPRLVRSLLQRPGVAVVLGLALVALVAERAVLSTGGGLLQGGRLLPAPDGASDLWSAYAATWSSTGPGTPAPAAPRTAVLAGLSTVLLGKPWLAVDLLLLGSVPLAGLTAWLAARRLVASRLLQVWAAATWALLPVATGAVAAGRVDVAAVQVALPLLAAAAVVVLRADPRGAWHRAWGLGLALAVVTALAPTLWLVAAPLLLGAGAAAVVGAAPAQRAPARRRAVAAALVAAVPVVLLLPWSLQVARTPGLLVHGPGRLAADPALADGDLPAWHLLGLSPGGAGLPPAWVGAGLLLAALAALVRRDRTGAVLRAWTAALAGLLLALLLVRVRSDAPVGPESLPVWPGVPLQVAAAGLLVAALLGADGVRDRLSRSAFGGRQLGAAVLAAAALAVPVVAAVSWMVRGADEPLQRQAPSAVPAFAEAELDADPGLRVLLLRPGADGRVAYELVTGAGARLGTADLPAQPAQRQAVDALAADLLTPSGSDAAAGLAARGVRYVALPRAAAGSPLAAALDTQAQLARRADDPVLLWEVLVPTARLVVLDPDAADDATSGSARGPRDASSVAALDGGRSGRVASGPAGRLLVLAEAADPGWRAELDGEPLEPVTAWSGVQAFALPRDGGTVVVGRDAERTAVLAAQATGLVLVAVLAAPGATRRRGLEPVDPGPGHGAPTGDWA